MAKALEYNATLVAREDLTPLLAVFRVKPDEPLVQKGADQLFEPGQYLTIGLNAEPSLDGDTTGKADSVRRPMSIASAPEQEGIVEFYIRYVQHPESDLPLTHLLWRRQSGARMYLRNVPTGHFTLEHTCGAGDRRLKVMVAAGTGLAPFISIVRSRVLRDPKARLDDIAILHGVSYPSDLGYRDELQRLAVEHGLKYVPTVSRAKDAPDWKGEVGRVEALLAPDRIARTEELMGLAPGGLVPSQAVILVCGLQGTIAESILGLIPRGFIPENRRIRKALEVADSRPSTFFYEQYDTEPVIDVKNAELLAQLRAQLAAAAS